MIQSDEGHEWDIWNSSPCSEKDAPELAELITQHAIATRGPVPPLEERIPWAWGRALRDLTDRKLRTESWIAECIANGYQTLATSLTIDPEVRSGVPVLKGTRFTASQALAELAETSGVAEFSGEFDIDATVVRDMLIGLSLILHRSCAK